MAESPLFQRNGEPVGFYIHKTVRNESQIINLTRMIEKHGGRVLKEVRGADTVIFDQSRDITRQQLQDVYSLNRDDQIRNVVVEPKGFVQACIQRKKFAHTVLVRIPVDGSVKPIRNDFTERDEANLCWFLSRKVPIKAHGGRLSHNLYKGLMALKEIDSSFNWVERHTAQSWREHYKKNQNKLDPKIEQYARTQPPEHPVRYRLDRSRMGKDKRRERGFERAYESDEDGVIHLTDESVKEEESDAELVLSSRREEEESAPEDDDDQDKLVSRKRKAKTSRPKPKPAKRRRIESSDAGPSSPQHQSPTPIASPERTFVSHSQSQSKGKQPEREGGNTMTSHPQPQSPPPPPFQPRSQPVIPVRDFQDPGPSQNRQRQREPIINMEDYELQRFSPEPGPTLVERRSSPPPYPLSSPTTSRDIQPQTQPRPSVASTSTSSQRPSLSSQRQHQPIVFPSPHPPSTSFRNVAHSSPIRPGSRFDTNFQSVSPGGQTGGVQSHNTSKTEPSSRSVIVPHELTVPRGDGSGGVVAEGNTSGRTEASIVKESTHKRTSPVPLPVKRGTSKPTPSQKGPSSNSNSNTSSVNRTQGLSSTKSKQKEKEQEKEREKEQDNWAPYRNTRARSRSASVEPQAQTQALPQVRKRVGRKGRDRVGAVRNEEVEVLEPLVESEQESRTGGEREGVQPVSVMTETLEEENDIAEFLMAPENISAILVGRSEGDDEEGEEEEGEEGEEEGEEGESEEDETEDEGEGERVPIVPKEEEEEEYSEETVSTGNPVSTETSHHNLPNVETLEEAEEESVHSDVEDDNEENDELYSEEPKLESDDAQINQMITASPFSISDDSDNDYNDTRNKREIVNVRDKSEITRAQEVLDMFGSPETKKPVPVQVLPPRQRKPHNVMRNGSPSPLKPRNQDTSEPFNLASLPLFPAPRTRPSASYSQTQPELQLQQVRRIIKEEPGTQTLKSQSQSQPRPSRVSFSGTIPIPSTLPAPSSKPNSSSGRKSLPYTPSPFIKNQKQSITRRVSADSTSSEAGFPLSGTRASALKQQLEEQLKVLPYTPPVGSKAAQVIASQQVQVQSQPQLQSQSQPQPQPQPQKKGNRGKGRG